MTIVDPLIYPDDSPKCECVLESLSEPSSAESDDDYEDVDEDEDDEYENDDLDKMDDRYCESQDGACESDRKRRRLDDFSSMRHRCSCTECRQVSMDRTLIIFDWDDTLLPSSWLLKQDLKITPNSRSPTDAERQELGQVADRVVKTLRRAKRLGTVVIITNAEKGWVELTCRHFFPGVAPLLEGVKVLSARSKFEPAWPSAPIQWKRQAFETEISAFFHMFSEPNASDVRENIISIGDSLHEREALIRATELRHCWKKSIKFLVQPSPQQLIKQHEHLSFCFSALAKHDDNVDLCLHIDKELPPVGVSTE